MNTIQDFQDGRDYLNVYLLFLDAKGHSTFVSTNDEENVFRVFDRLEDEVARAYNDAATAANCLLVQQWGWMGDGGLVVFWDTKEGNARRAALQASRELLKTIDVLNGWISDDPTINGSIHLRLALHKGGLRYRAATGSIHSTALNLAAHAEKAAPTDTLVISDDVYRVCSEDEKTDYVSLEAPLEGTLFYGRSLAAEGAVLIAAWKEKVAPPVHVSGLRTNVPLERLGLVALFSQRAETGEYAAKIEEAHDEVSVLGMALSGFVTDHADLLRRRVSEGLQLRVLLPSDAALVDYGEGSMNLLRWRVAVGGVGAGDLAERDLAKSVAFLDELAEEHPDNVDLRRYHLLPSGAALIFSDVVYFSPFLAGEEGLKTFTVGVERHGLIGTQLVAHFEAMWFHADAAS